jgi:hypothetical protein
MLQDRILSPKLAGYMQWRRSDSILLLVLSQEVQVGEGGEINIA